MRPTAPHSRTLRRNSTKAERELWSYLRNRTCEGFKFRRQHPIGPYYADFACLTARLVVELDGLSHEEREDYDAQRDEYMKAQRWTVLRFDSNLVFSNPEGIWCEIQKHLNGASSQFGIGEIECDRD